MPRRHARHPRARRALAVAVVTLLTSAAPLRADTATWLPAAPTSIFSDPANWSPSAPAPTDAALFNTGTPHTVSLTADTTTDQLQIANDSLTLDLAGHAYTLANTNSPYATALTLGSPTAPSSLTLTNSAPAPAALSVLSLITSPNPTDTSSLTLTGPDTTLVGYNVPNTAYSTFTFGKAGAATLTLTNGAFLDAKSANTAVTLAQNAGSAATVTVAGPDTRFANSSLSIGSAGNADVTITAGATLSANTFYLGRDAITHTAAGSLTIDGATLKGYPLNYPGATYPGCEVYVGERSRGTLTFRGGATATLGYLYVGSGTSSAGAVTVQDPGTSVTATNVYLGGTSTTAPGAGSLTISAGSLTVTDAAPIVRNTPGTSLTLAGGTLSVPTLDLQGHPENFHWTGGTLNLTNAAFQVGNPTASPALNAKFNAGASYSLPTSATLKLSGSNYNESYLVVDNGGTLTVPNASLSLATDAYVGYATTGTLALTNHAFLTSSGNLFLGYFSSMQFGTGTLTLDDHSYCSVNGPGTAFSTGSLAIGPDGTGSVAVRGGSTLSATSASVGNGAPSSLEVDGFGSTFLTSTLTVGQSSPSTLTLSNGATTSTSLASVSSSILPAGPSTATLAGPATAWNNTGTLYVARPLVGTITRAASGSLALSDSASLSTANLYVSTGNTSSTGSISLSSNASLSVSNNLYLGATPTTVGGAASLSLTDSSASVASTLKLGPAPGTSLSLTRSSLTLGVPSSPTATLDNSATLSLSDHSALTLYGTFTNPGAVTLSPDSTFTWSPGPTLADPAATLRDQLLTQHLRPASPEPTHALGYRPIPSALVVQLALLGDANLDGQLNADDYALLDRSLAVSQTNALWTDGDFNYDGIINNQDYLLVDTTLGQQQGGRLSPAFLAQRESEFGSDYVSTLLANVPEPLPLSSILYPLSSLLLTRRRGNYAEKS